MVMMDNGTLLFSLFFLLACFSGFATRVRVLHHPGLPGEGLHAVSKLARQLCRVGVLCINANSCFGWGVDR